MRIRLWYLNRDLHPFWTPATQRIETDFRMAVSIDTRSHFLHIYITTYVSREMSICIHLTIFYRQDIVHRFRNFHSVHAHNTSHAASAQCVNIWCTYRHGTRPTNFPLRYSSSVSTDNLHHLLCKHHKRNISLRFTL
jgi:hypothetical protein